MRGKQDRNYPEEGHWLFFWFGVLFCFVFEKFSENVIKRSGCQKSTHFLAQRQKSSIFPCEMFFLHPHPALGQDVFLSFLSKPQSNRTFLEHFHVHKKRTEAPSLGTIEPGCKTDSCIRTDPQRSPCGINLERR